jgi:hypothetical protein
MSYSPGWTAAGSTRPEIPAAERTNKPNHGLSSSLSVMREALRPDACLSIGTGEEKLLIARRFHEGDGPSVDFGARHNSANRVRS